MTQTQWLLIGLASGLLFVGGKKVNDIVTGGSHLTSADCQKKYGSPQLKKAIVFWKVPQALQIGAIPKTIYCNKDMVKPLTLAFQNLITRGFVRELKTWDGCLNIRKKRSGSTMSLHSWAVALDVNATSNAYGAKPTLSAGFVKCFTDAGFEWGGNWSKPDGMHFQLKKMVVLT